MKRTLNLALVGLASAVSTAAFAQTISVAGPFDFVDTLIGPEAALNTVVPNAATVGTGYQFGSNAVVDSITVNSLIPGTWESEASVQLVNSAFPGLSASLTFSNTGAAFASFSIAAPTVRAFSANTLISSNLPSGSTWTLTFFESFSDGPGADANGTGLVMTPNAFVPPPPPPPALPILYNNGSIVNSPGAGPAGSDLSIIGTEGTGGTFGVTSSAPNFALADDFVVPAGGWTVAAISGYAYQTNGSTSTSPFSGILVNIWDGDPTLPTSNIVATSTTVRDNRWTNAYRVTATTLTNTARGVYRIEAEFPNIVLPAGTYYAAYQVETANAGAAFTPLVMQSTLPATTTAGNGVQFNGTLVVPAWGPALIGTPATFQPAIPFLVHGPLTNQTLSGTLNLNDTVFGGAYTRTITGTVKQGATTVGTITVSGINSSSTAFSGDISASATGAATIEWDGSSFLLRKTNITLTGSNLAVGTVSLQNGDVDGSGEVDAADIDEVIANFGSGDDINSDVDVSGEVDAADIDIVIANFGGTDD